MTYIQNVKFNVPFETAFKMQLPGSNSNDVDTCAVQVMITENFKNDRPRDRSNSENNEIRYQHKGNGHYGDIIRLFGWDVFVAFYQSKQEDFIDPSRVPENMKSVNYYDTQPSTNLDYYDGRTLRLSNIVGFDLTPLMYFWGVHPINPALLAEKITAASIPSSPAIKQHIENYRTMIPANNAEFNDFFEHVHPGRPTECASPLYGCGWYNQWRERWNEADAEAARAQVDNVIAMFF